MFFYILMSSVKKFFSVSLLHSANFLRKTQLGLLGLSEKLDDSQDTNIDLTRQILDQIGNDPDEFRKSAAQLAESLDTADIKLKEAVYLYFLTKQAASIYEAKINYLPLQVYNEMRNALDHYFRALVTSNQERKASHIGKMEGHLQRAFLDITKLTCAGTMENIDRTHNRIGDKPISLVNNGEYIKFFTNLKVHAENKLIKAKRLEYSLGDGNESNVRDSYIEALTAHILTYNFYKENLPNLYWGKARWLVLKPATIGVSIFIGACGGYLSRVFWAGTENWPIIQQAIGFVKSLSS